MHALRCVLAEWQLLRARLLRSRLGLWLLLLGAGAAWLAAHASTADLPALALAVAMLGAVLGVAFAAGSDADRASLLLTLTHPTSPLAVATGRWLAAVTAATCLLVAWLFVAGARDGFIGLDFVRVAIAGAAAAAAIAAGTLVAVWSVGNALAGVLFLYIGVLSTLSPDALRSTAPPSALRSVVVAVLELLPGVWRYHGLTAGDTAAWGHAALWVATGVPLAALVLRRRLA